jgi:hypothetical protein
MRPRRSCVMSPEWESVVGYHKELCCVDGRLEVQKADPAVAALVLAHLVFGVLRWTIVIKVQFATSHIFLRAKLVDYLRTRQ